MTTAILVHGVPTTARLWDGLIEHLDGSRRVVALDLPGFSEPPPSGWIATKENYAAWLLREVEAVATHDGPIHLVGHDWGCLLSCRVASLRPDLLRSLTFGNGPIDEHWPLHAFWREWNVPGDGERWMDELDVDAMGSALLSGGMTDAMVRALPWRHQWNREVTLTLYRSAVNVGREWSADLARIVIPSMALWGQLDLIVPIEIGRRMAARMGAEVVGLNASHFWPAELPADAVRELERHWRRAEASPTTIFSQHGGIGDASGDFEQDRQPELSGIKQELHADLAAVRGKCGLSGLESGIWDAADS
jgi:pimeloyl-ACP methyl ester carboxylesterase